MEQEALLGLARTLSRRALKGHSGLGALRHHRSVAMETARLISQSGVLDLEHEAKSFPLGVWGIDPEYLFDFPPFRHHAEHFVLRLVGATLVHPSSFDPSPMWALWWALVKAEHEFLSRFVPFWSNEERLTGHLVSQLAERIDEFRPHWRSLAEGDSGAAGTPRCELQYFDTATARQEKLTGADLGLVVHAQFPWHDEFFKVARFQAKKADRGGKARLDLDQLETLLGANGLGYYLFYHELREEPGTPAPTVRDARDFQRFVDEARKPQAGRRPGGPGDTSIDALDTGWDFAALVTFGLADPSSAAGVMQPTAERAADAVLGRGMPTRVMVMTLGSPPVVNWRDLIQGRQG
jgi:hypothetical protein